MKITKEQQKELKKIDSSYSQIERLTIKSNLNMKSVLRSIFSFDVINLNDKDRQKVFSQNQSRQELFERSKVAKKKDKANTSAISW